MLCMIAFPPFLHRWHATHATGNPLSRHFLCDDALTCASRMEYYTHQKKSVAWFDADMCVHCIGQLGVGQRHKDMQDVYYVVLPICQHPRQMGGSTSYVSSSQTASRCSRILTRSWPGKP